MGALDRIVLVVTKRATEAANTRFKARVFKLLAVSKFQVLELQKVRSFERIGVKARTEFRLILSPPSCLCGS